MKLILIAALAAIGLSAQSAAPSEQFASAREDTLADLVKKEKVTKEICGVDEKGKGFIIKDGKRQKVRRGKLLAFIKDCPDISASRKAHLLRLLGNPTNISIASGY